MHPDMYDNKGTSLVVTYTEKGLRVFNNLDFKKKEITFEDAYRYNPCIVQSSHESRFAPIFRYFFKQIGVKAMPKTLGLMAGLKVIRFIILFFSKILIKNG